MNLSILNTWAFRAFILAFAFIVGMSVGLWIGDNRLEKLKADYAEQVSKALEENRALEKKMQADADELTVKYQKEKKDAEKTISDLRHRIADGSLRLSVRTESANGMSAGSGSEHREERAELDRTTAQSLVSIVSDGDDAIRDLNQCIDKYNAIRRNEK